MYIQNLFPDNCKITTYTMGMLHLPALNILQQLIGLRKQTFVKQG